MDASGGLFELISKMKNFHAGIRKVQDQYRKYKEHQERRRAVLTDYLWEREKHVLYKQCQQKKTKRKQFILRRINAANQPARDAAIKLYEERCRVRHYARFLEWRLDY